MAITFSDTNKPLNPRGNDASPKGYNKAAIYSGKALDFDGANDIVDLDGFTMAGNVATLSFYLKADDWDANSFIFAAGTPEIVIGSTTGGNNLSFYDSSSWQTFAAISDTTSTNFFSIVFNGTSAIAYMNGVQFGSVLTITPINISSVSGVKLMSKYTGDAFFFNGQMAGFKIFNTALTAAQVADLYNNPEKIVPTGLESNLKLWLPMQEGAGTTAYDGSGNANHGTISGATYVNGIGAPVAQTAVIDWNKGGENYVKHSENIVTGWTLQNVAASINSLEAPDGLTTATKFTASAVDVFHLNNFTYASASAGIWKESVFAKAGEVDFAYLVIRVNNGSDRYGVKFDLTDGTFVDDITTGSPTNTGYEITDAGNGWYKCTIQALHTSGNITNVLGPNIAGNLVDINGSHQGDGVSGMYMWGASLQPSTAGDSYIRTGATAQTSPVLLPQGLTAGRDITGVNLFENVRKQGALNLDGSSFAEVHDNESLDVTTAVTLEAWVQIDDADGSQSILGKWNYGAPKKEYLIYYASSTNKFQAYFGHGSGVSVAEFPITATGQWFHLVATTDGSTITPYVNGVAGTTAAQSTPLAASDIPLKIGTDDTGADKTKKPIAQPRIYNRALSAEEIQRNFDAGKNIYS